AALSSSKSASIRRTPVGWSKRGQAYGIIREPLLSQKSSWCQRPWHGVTYQPMASRLSFVSLRVIDDDDDEITLSAWVKHHMRSSSIACLAHASHPHRLKATEQVPQRGGSD